MPFLSSKKKVSPREAAKAAKRETRRGIRSNQRDLDREMRELDREEQRLKSELKRQAKRAANQNDPLLKTLAKQLVQVRQNRDKLVTTRGQIGAMGMHATTMSAQVSAVSAVGTMTDTLKKANGAMNMQETIQMMATFQRENEKINAKEELMDDVLADAFDNDEVEEEAEQLTGQVLAELGLEMDSKLSGLDAPNSKPQQTQAEQEHDDFMLPDLQARLNAL